MGGLKFGSQGRSRSQFHVIKRSLHLALLFVLIGLGVAPVRGAAPGAVTGVVRDSAGVPQIGAVVQLLRPDFTVLASVYTNSKGAFAFAQVSPGRYAVKAMSASLLPSMRENVRVRTSTTVNLTLNTLYEVLQWLPAQRRDAGTQEDDWAWTLRSAANRPLLRWLENGPLVVATDGPKATPKLKARLVATGKQGSFGENGERIAVELEETPSESRELLASVDFEPGTDGAMESMLGFRQELGYVGAVQTVAAVAIRPDIQSAAGEGLDEAAIRSWQTMTLGDLLDAEAGTEQVIARAAGADPVMAALPFVTVGWKHGEHTLQYRMATALPPGASQGETHASAWMPGASMLNGSVVLERGTHHELGWKHQSDAATYSVAVYSDRLNNPVLQASTGQSSSDGPPSSARFGSNALYDPSSGIIRVAGNAYSSTGLVATAQHSLPFHNTLRASYANGTALAMRPGDAGQSLGEVVHLARPRRVQMYSLSLSGTLEGTGTRWRASYRWQPEDTVTRVAAYDADASDPYLNVHLRQPMHRVRNGAKSLDAMLDMRNVLSEGGQRFVLTDGSLLVFAQDQRSVSAGLVFTF